MKIMNSNSWKSALCIGGLCGFGLLANAAPLARADVVAHPAWLLHLDCDALRPTAIGKYILAEMDKPEAKDKLAAFQTMFALDLRTQLHGATLYGTSSVPEEGLLLVYADFDAEHLVSLAKAAKDSQSTLHGKIEIYNWIDDKKPAKNGVQPRTYAAIVGNRVIFGQREDCVSRALDVLAGSAPNLAGEASFSDLGRPKTGHFVEAAARKMALPDSDPNAAILKMAQSVQLVMGESQGQFDAAVTLVADNAEVSGHVLSIVQGLLALAKLQTDKPESVKVANAINLTQAEERVVGSLHLPAADVVEVMKADAARKAAKAAKAAKTEP